MVVLTDEEWAEIEATLDRYKPQPAFSPEEMYAALLSLALDLHRRLKKLEE